MNPKSEPLTTKTVDLPASSSDSLPPPITLERLIQLLPKNLSDETVDRLLDVLYHLEACFCERYAEQIQRLIERDYNPLCEPPDCDLEDTDDNIPF